MLLCYWRIIIILPVLDFRTLQNETVCCLDLKTLNHSLSISVKRILEPSLRLIFFWCSFWAVSFFCSSPVFATACLDFFFFFPKHETHFDCWGNRTVSQTIIKFAWPQISFLLIWTKQRSLYWVLESSDLGQLTSLHSSGGHFLTL